MVSATGPPARTDRERQGDTDLAEVLVEFAHTLGTNFSIQGILDHLVARIVQILPISGAGVMLMGARDELHFISASNDLVTQIEHLQNELGEGPCVEAYATGKAVAITDLGNDERFPRFSPRAAAAGLAAVFTFPLRLDDSRLGALDLYRSSAGPLSPHDMHSAQILADVAAAYLFNAQTRLDASATVARLNHRSLHDPLTGLANRTLLEELLDQLVSRARRSHHLAAVLFIDLDGFKAVNDRYGHYTGDELLRAVADRIGHLLRPADTLARLGGDEFVVLCEDLLGHAAAESIAHRITTELALPFRVAGRTISVAASVGVAFSGEGQDVPAALLRNADFAMYQAKGNGGGHHRVIGPASHLVAERREGLDADLEQAQRRDQLSLVYQPIVALRTGRVVAAEALLRWHHPERGAISPAVIIPSAERTGLILSLGEWVLHQACRALQVWGALGPPVAAVAVNVSAHQVMGPSFAHTVERVLDATGVDPAAVCLEVTESLFLADVPRVLTVLGDLKSTGVTLALDDFGTGYSSLNYLRQFPFDAVKIDRSFTAAALTDTVTRSIVTAMIQLGHALGIAVTVEGVESEGQLRQITELDADYAQGFRFSPALTPPQLTTYVQGLEMAGAEADEPAPRYPRIVSAAT